MPKKFKGENSKAVVAKARKAEVIATENAQKEKEKEDETWRDDNKTVMKKQQRKADKDKKKQDDLMRKQAARQLLEEEENSMPISKPGSGKPLKLTRADIEANQERQRAEAEQAEQQQKVVEAPLEDNPNIALARAAAEGQLEARNVEDAISVLSINEQPAVDKHPEKRMKAAYAAFEEIHLPRLKAENPNLRLSQLKQMLKKDWGKSPDNPLNQRLAGAQR